MSRLLPILLAGALVVVGCSSGDQDAAEDPTVTVTVPDPDHGEEDQDAQIARSVLAFVDTSPTGTLGVEIEPGTPPPTSIEVAVIEDPTRSGQVGTDGVATVAYVLRTWDGEIVERSSDLAERLSVKLGVPSDAPPDAVVLPTPFEELLDRKPVGARLTALFPAGTAGLPIETAPDQAHVLVLDILAFQRPEDS